MRGRHPHLLSALREELDVTSPKDGCSPSGQCGCCTVLIDGKAVVSCQQSLEKVEGSDIVTLEGSGFVRISDAVPGRASWVLCDRRPERLDDVPHLCATPRTVREPVIDRNGTFALSLLVPDPSVLRTWVSRQPLTCAERCWLVVLAEPFPEVAAVPIGIGGR